MEEFLNEMKETQMKALKALEKYPKNKKLRMMAKGLTLIIKDIEKIENEETGGKDNDNS